MLMRVFSWHLTTLACNTRALDKFWGKQTRALCQRTNTQASMVPILDNALESLTRIFTLAKITPS